MQPVSSDVALVQVGRLAWLGLAADGILTKLDLPVSEAEHRRVLAVLRFLEAR